MAEKKQCPNADKIFRYNIKEGNYSFQKPPENILKKLKVIFCDNRIGMTRIYKRVLMISKNNPSKKSQQSVPVGWLCETCKFIVYDKVEKDGKE